MHDNIVYNCFYGIYLNHSSNIQLYNNIIDGHGHDCYNGILLSNGCNNITIFENKIYDSEYWGILLWIESNNNAIYDNYFSDNYIAIQLSEKSNNNSIEENHLVDIRGVGIAFWSSSNNKICGNVFEKCDWGLYVIESSQNNLIDNNVFKNGWDGINIMDNSNGNTITNNIIDNFTGDGVYVAGSHRNYIYRNIISNNNNGVNIFYKSYRNNISENNFKNNEVNALFYSSFLTTWDKNYWGQQRDTPYLIWGRIGPSPMYRLWKLLSIPWIQFDWHPAQEPYDIPIPEVP